MRIPRPIRRREGIRWRYTPLLLASALAASLAAPALAATIGGTAPARSHNPDPNLPLSLALADKAQPGTVTLVTGERVRLLPGPDGRAAVSVVPAARSRLSSTALIDAFEIKGDVYAVPGYALPYLGSRLDPRLFDVSYLRRAGYAGLKSLPVSVTWRTGSHSMVPGLAASTVGRTTSAAMSPSSAAAFGQMLATALRSPSSAAAASFAQVARVSLGSAPTAATASPAVPLRSSQAPSTAKVYTLTINALDRAGKLGYALIAVQDLNNFQRYYSVSATSAGSPLQISVPAGSYAIEVGVNDYGFSGFAPMGSASLIPLPKVTISGDTVLTVDARQAQPISIQVPQQAATQVAGMSFSRTSATGGGLTAIMYGWGPAISSQVPAVHMYAKPTPAPSTGSLGFSDSWELQTQGTGPGGTNVPFTYNLDFASANGVPTTLSHTLTAADLAAQHDSFASSVPATASGSGMYSAAEPFHAWSPITFALTPTFDSPFPVPTTRTDYFGGSTDTVWDQGVEPTQPTSGTYILGRYQTYHPGQNLNVTWGAGPSLPLPEWQNMGLPPGSRPYDGMPRGTWAYICPVCQQGQLLAFNLALSGDNDPTHSEGQYGIGSGTYGGPAGTASDQIRFYRNGVLTQIASRSGQVFPLLPGKANYRIDWDSTIPVGWTQLATSTDSTWRFTADGNAAPGKIPPYEVCSPDSTQQCSFLPLVFASYNFGANLQGQVTAPGTKTFTVRGFHEANDSGPAINHAAVQVSFDDGKTWAPATGVTGLGGGRFKVTITQPAPSATSGYASFKVTLTDAAGDSLQQTILRAYALTSTQGR